MNVREYFELKMTPVCGAAISYLDRVHPHSEPDATDDDKFGAILASMPADSPCGAACTQAIDNAALVCADIRMAFGDDIPRLYENVVYTNLRVLSCFICG